MKADCGNVSGDCCGIVRITDDLTGVRHLELLLNCRREFKVTLLPAVRGRSGSMAASNRQGTKSCLHKSGAAMSLLQHTMGWRR